MPLCSKGDSLKDGSAVKKVYPHPGTFACHANMGLSKCHPYRGGFPFPGTIVELDMLAQCGDVPLCPCCGWTECRYPSPHYSHELWGGHTLCYRWKHSERWPVPLLPRKMCQSRYVSHLSTRLFSFLSKRCSFIFYCQQISSWWVGLCQDGLHVGLCPWETRYRGHPEWEPSSFWRPQLELSSNLPGMCVVSCRSGFTPFLVLPLLSAGIRPSTAPGWPRGCLHCTVTIPLSSACDFRMQINYHIMSLYCYKCPLKIGRATFSPDAN